MKLLFERKQSRSALNKPVFSFFAKIDLASEESDLIHKYQMSSCVLIDVEEPGLLRNSVGFGFLIFCLVTPILAANFWSMLGLGVIGVVLVSLVIAVACGVLFYHQTRETIYLKDLIVGRYFQCGSVVALARKEAWLEGVTATLRQVLEGAKHWGGTEIREIPVLPKEEALKLIARG